ncbi:MAG TPA: hypothetical protein VGN57_01325, partial [Pirellulaceae bacterium]|nr:hypothetical protein [Pirellulaceae bacterium]
PLRGRIASSDRSRYVRRSAREPHAVSPISRRLKSRQPANREINGLLDGFVAAFHAERDAEIKRSKSLILWRFLVSHVQQNSKLLNAVRRYYYYVSRYQQYPSLAAVTLRKAAWIPTVDGEFLSPPSLARVATSEAFGLASLRPSHTGHCGKALRKFGH